MYNSKKLETIEEEIYRNPHKNFFPFIKFLDESYEGQALVKRYGFKKVSKPHTRYINYCALIIPKTLFVILIVLIVGWIGLLKTISPTLYKP
jgi:hypothetical protein